MPSPAESITAVVTAVEPDLDPAVIAEALDQAAPAARQQRSLAKALAADTALLTSGRPTGPPTLGLLIVALRARGAQHLVQPRCAACGKVKDLTRRNDQGERICNHCAQHAPHRHRPCSRCGRSRPVHTRVDGQPLCTGCSIRRPDTCATCGRNTNCYSAGTDHPQCSGCRRRAEPRTPCSRCRRPHPVAARTPDGQPLCGGCGARREPCTRCGHRRRVATRLDGEPLCPNCARTEPTLHQPCVDCGRVERLHHHGRCPTCAYPHALSALLTGPDGRIAQHVQPVFTALAAADPQAGLAWLQRSRRQAMLTALAARTGPFTHAALDRLGSPRVVRGLRAILVNTGVLPWRDEILANLEHWLTSTIAQVTDPAERQLLRSYATWHHVRRLRAASARQPLTFTQSRYVRMIITTSIELLTWLRERDQSLATCTQADVDAWLAIDTRHDTRGFLTWAVERRHAHGVHIPAFETTKTYQTLPDQDQRWTLARTLLHDDTLDTGDRVAGLLVLLFAQHLSTITRLTTGQLTTADGHVELRLGTAPLVLPSPLGDLALRVATNRRGHAIIGHHDDHPWLFPGGAPGQPLSTSQLARRLKRLGITARLGRNTALIDLAAQLPAAVLSQLLGISISRATHWNSHAGNTRPGYAAAVARRNELRVLQ